MSYYMKVSKKTCYDVDIVKANKNPDNTIRWDEETKKSVYEAAEEEAIAQHDGLGADWEHEMTLGPFPSLANAEEAYERFDTEQGLLDDCDIWDEEAYSDLYGEEESV